MGASKEHVGFGVVDKERMIEEPENYYQVKRKNKYCTFSCEKMSYKPESYFNILC